MTRKAPSAKRSFIMSLTSLIICVAMLLGTTFAWFSETISSGINTIKSGNLDVELGYAKVKDGVLQDFATVTESTNDIFDPNALWEPGRVEVVYLKISNRGTLDLKYQLGINVYEEIAGKNVKGEEFKLSDYLVFKVIDVEDAKSGDITPFTDRKAVAAAAGTEMGLATYNSGTTALEDGAVDYVAVIVYMPETVGNEANYRGDAVPTIKLGVNLVATQVEAENDSFDNKYDEDAWAEGMKVHNAQDLQAAINNGVANIELMADIELTESLNVPKGVKITLDLNNKKITGVGRNEAGKVNTLVNNGNAVIKNGIVTSTGVNGGSAILNTGVLIIENVTVNGAPSDTGTGTASYAVNTEGAGSELTVINSNISGRGAIGATKGTKVEINGGTFHTPAVAWGHAVYAYNEGTEVVINGGTFSEGYEMTANNWGMYQIYSGDKAKVTVNGGYFTEWDCANGYDLCSAGEGVIEIYGGTFADNPTNQNKNNYVAAGYKAVNPTSGVYVVVSNSIENENVVATPTQLVDALTNASNANSGDNTIVLAGNIDLANATWKPIKVDGYNGAGVVTVEGNGATIKGLTAPLFEGGFAGKSGIVIKNLTIADSDIVSNSGLGGGAFIDSADSMHVLTLENCHLVNSTVTGERTGGLIGWCTGYAKLNDGPVKAYVTIKGCSVVDSTVHGAGSAGAIAGHPGASDYTYTTIENCVVKNVNVISDEPIDSWRTGAIVGTANNGHVVINNVKVENVTLTQDGVTATETKLYGRFVPAGTGTLVIDGMSVAETAAQLSDALAKGEDVVLFDDVNVPKTEAVSNGYGVAGVQILNGSDFDGNGNNLGVNAWDTWDCAINTTGGTIKNVIINSGMRGIFVSHNSNNNSKVILDNVVIDGTIYTISCDQGTNQGLEATNSTFNGWTSYAATIGDVEFTNCSFGEGQGYAFCRPYAPTTFVGCDFAEGYELDAVAAVTFENCTINGQPLTAENLSTLVTGGIANATVK